MSGLSDVRKTSQKSKSHDPDDKNGLRRAILQSSPPAASRSPTPSSFRRDSGYSGSLTQPGSSSSTPTFRYTCDTVRQTCSGPAVNNFLFVTNHFQQPGDYNVRMAFQGDMFHPFSRTFSTDGGNVTESRPVFGSQNQTPTSPHLSTQHPQRREHTSGE